MEVSRISHRMKREVSKADQCKAMELGGKVSSTINDVVNDLDSIPIIGDFLGIFTGGISAVTHLFSGGLDIAQTAADCGDVPFDEIKEIMNKRFNEIDRKLDEQTAALREITTLVNKTLITVEQTRLEMNTRFDEVIESIEITQVDPIISKIYNFVQYFYTESERIKGLNINEYIKKLIEKDNNFLVYLSEYRTPQGLLAFLLNLIKQRYAVPDSSHDKAAFKAIDALIYGTHTYVAVMFFLIEQYAYLVNYYYHISDVDSYNKFLDGMINSFKDFRTSLIGRGIAGKEEPLLVRVISLLKEVNSLDFVWASKARRLTDSIRSFEIIKHQIKNMTLPVIEEVPQNYVQFSFQKSITTPVGDWVAGKYVSYAVQYKSDGKYAKIGEWSHPVLVKGKACPTLKIPNDKLRRDRLLFRKFRGEMPKLVGVLKASETEIDERSETDISRDFYDAVDSPDKEVGLRDAKLLSMAGADTNAMFEKGRQAIHAAAKWGNTKIASNLLLGKSYTSINARDKDGFTPLHVAVEAGQDEFMDLLIRHRCSVTAQTYPLLLTPLHLAARNGFSKTLDALLKMRNSNADAKDLLGFTPLHNAVMGGEQVVDMLVKSGRVDINGQSNTKLTPFHLAVINNDMKVALSLIGSKQVDVNAGDENNMTPLHHAAMMGHLEMVNYLLTMNGIKINEGTRDNNWTPLHYAIFFRKDDVSKHLLEDGRLKLRTAANGWLTALHFAVTFGRKEVLLAIIKRGVLIDQQTREGYSPLHLAAMRETPDMLNILIQNKAKVNFGTFKNSTPLHEAAFRGRLENVLVLLDKNANIRAEDESGNLPIHKAAFNGAISVIDLFLRRDKNLLDHKNKLGETPLHLAAQNMNSVAVRFLKNKGAIVDVKNSDGVTPLHAFAKGGQLDMIKYLIGNGAGLYDYDVRYNDFMYYAIQNGHFDIVKYAFDKERYNYSNIAKKHIPLRCPKTCPWVICDANEFDQLDMMKYFFDKLNPKDCVLVSEAAVYGHLDIIKYFIQERNADFEKESPTADPALCSAAHAGHLNIVRYLIEKDASAKNSCNKNGILNRAIAAKVSSETKLEILKLLVLKGADVNERDLGGKLPLHNAIFAYDFLVVKYLVEELNISVNEPTTDQYRDTPLHLAVKLEQAETVKFLVEKGADLHAKNSQNKTPYNIAREHNNAAIVRILEQKIDRFYRSVTRSLNENKLLISNLISKKDDNHIFHVTTEKGKDNIKILDIPSVQNMDLVGTLLLLDLFIRRFTGQKYGNNTDQANFENHSLVKALKMTENLQHFLNSKPLEEELDLFEIFSNIKRAITSGSGSKLHKIMCTFIDTYRSLDPETVQDLLNDHFEKEKVRVHRKTISLKRQIALFINLWHSAEKSCFTVENTPKSLDA